jgi:hypothetical protein
MKMPLPPLVYDAPNAAVLPLIEGTPNPVKVPVGAAEVVSTMFTIDNDALVNLDNVNKIINAAPSRIAICIVETLIGQQTNQRRRVFI